MKRILLLVCLFPLIGKAQSENIQGTYDTEEKLTRFRINADNTFDIINFSGRYTVDEDGTINFMINKEPIFAVEEKAKGTSPTLKINYKTGYFSETLKYVYIGYEDANKQVKYENLYNKLSENENLDDQEVSLDSQMEFKTKTYTFEIPKTDNLYLVSAFPSILLESMKDMQANASIEKYPIGKNTSELEVSYNFENLYSYMMNLKGKYNATNKSILIKGFYGNKTLVLQKKSNNNPNNIEMISQEEISNWEHLVKFEDDFASSLVETRVKLDIKNTLEEALKASKKDDKPLLVFYQPENTEASKAGFFEAIEKYEVELGYYSEDSFAKYDKVNFYFADKKDEKWFKNKKINVNKNQLILLNGDGVVLYHEENTPANVSDNFSVESALFTALRWVYTGQKIDRILSNKKATIPQIESAFLLLFNDEFDNFKIISDKQQNTTDSYSYFYEEAIKNKANLYKFNTTSTQASQQWKKMVDAHNKDTELNANYATILGKNYQEYRQNYLEKLFNIKREFDQTDIDAIHYLVKFHQDIQNYNENRYLSDENNDYEQITRLYSDDISHILNQIAEKQPNMINRVKEIYAEGEQKNIFRYDEFADFLDKYFPEEHFHFFEKYFQKITSADANIILALDKIYSENKSIRDEYSSWTYYKLFFANNCNNIAWKVVENYKNDQNKLEKALLWSKTSLEVAKENPYYWDTYAHLLYFANKKDKAIEAQRKAVNILDQAKQIYDQGNEDDIRETLKKMENGTL